MTFTLPKWGLRSPLRLSKLQSSIVGVKKPRLEAFFISLENYRSVAVENGLARAIWTFAAQVMAKKRPGMTIKVKNQPDLGVCRWSAIHRWKAFKKSYKFASNLIPIGGLNKKL